MQFTFNKVETQSKPFVLTVLAVKNVIDVDDDGHNCIVNATSKLTDHKQKTVALVRFVKIT